MRKIEEVFVNGICLKEILDKHKKWVDEEEGGERANLSFADLSLVDLSFVDLFDANLKFTNLSHANLSHADLSHVDLTGSDLTRANLRYTDLRNADLSFVNFKTANLNEADLSSTNLCEANLKSADLINAKLRYANLSEANLTCADLEGADLSHTDLTYANLMSADLRNTNLSCANLMSADLRNARLSNAILNDVAYNVLTTFLNLQCPEKGSFIGYKKADKKIVELLITEDAKRSSGTSRKCRCSKAKVLSITNVGNTVEYKEVHSDFNYSFVYRVGEIVEVKDFDEDRWKECSTGIHFFLTRDEAVNY